MGATRLVMTMAVVGIAAGAYLAIATVPSFAPYQERRRSAPVILAEPESPAYALARPQRDDDSFGVRPGPEQGTLTLDLPQWAEDTGEWMAFGQRAWRAWQSWDRPDRNEDPRDDGWDTRRSQRFAGRRDREDDDYGYAPRYRPDDDHEYDQGYEPRERRRDDGGYAQDERWAPPATVPERGPAPRQPSPQDDAAAGAARRAEQAARDVLGALNPQ